MAIAGARPAARIHNSEREEGETEQGGLRGRSLAVVWAGVVRGGPATRAGGGERRRPWWCRCEARGGQGEGGE